MKWWWIYSTARSVSTCGDIFSASERSMCKTKEGWGMSFHQGHSSMPRLSFSRPIVGEYAWLTHTGQLKRERQPLRSSCEAYRTSPGRSTTFALLIPHHCSPLLADWELETLALFKSLSSRKEPTLKPQPEPPGSGDQEQTVRNSKAVCSCAPARLPVAGWKTASGQGG